MYFRLNPECYLIRGKKRGAIYDLIDAKIYALDQNETDLVTSCENNNPIIRDERLLHELKKLCLGNFYPNPIYVQKLKTDSYITDKYDPLFPIAPPALHKAFLEINNLCQRDCWFCGYHGIKRSLGCLGCNRWKENGKPLDVEQWKGIVDDLRDLECQNIFITGGDLTLAWDKAMEILDHAKKNIGTVYVVLHQASLTSDIMADIDKKIKILVQSDDPNKIQFENSTTLLVMKPKDWAKAKSIGDRNLIKDFVIEDGEFPQKEHPSASKDKIFAPGMSQFLSNIEYHPCLGHTLSICHNGDVTPCPMMRNHPLGSVSNAEFWAVFKENWMKISEYWRLNLDKIEKCSCCEFRYACTDCRAFEESSTGRLNGKALCNYDPSEGVWR